MTLKDIFKNAETNTRAMHGRAIALIEAHKESVRQAVSRFGGFTASGGSGATSDAFGRAQAMADQDSDSAKRQYDAFKDTPFTAIRPIMNTAAAQPIRVGVNGSPESVRKLHGADSYYASYAVSDALITKMVGLAPEFITKEIGTNVTPLESHPLLDLLSTPNEHMTGYSLKQTSFASLALVGRFVWWFDMTGGTREDVPELGNLRLWYIPRSWIRRAEGSDTAWKIQAPGMASHITVDANSLFMPTVANPGNPFKAFSPLQSQAKSVDTEDKILRAQAVSMDNAIRPSMILSVGRLPGMPGSASRGPRPMLTGDQRDQVIGAVRALYGGTQRYGDPLILDALIEDAKPFMLSPAELDMPNSTAIVQRRIMEGIGVSPVVAGFAENVNRAGSTTAKEIFYDVCMNPMIEGVSQDMDGTLGRRFSGKGRRLRVWMERAVADDPDAVFQRASAFGESCMTLEEKRDYIATGKIKLKKLTPEEIKQLQESAMKRTAESVPREMITGR